MIWYLQQVVVVGCNDIVISVDLLLMVLCEIAVCFLVPSAGVMRILICSPFGPVVVHLIVLAECVVPHISLYDLHVPNHGSKHVRR